MNDYNALSASELQALAASKTKELEAKLEKLEKENAQFRTGYAKLGIDPTWSPYHQSRKAEAVGKAAAELTELNEKAQEQGFKSLRTLVYGASKASTPAQLNVPIEWKLAPVHWTRGAGLEKRYHFRNGLRREYMLRVTAVTTVQAQRKLEALWPMVEALDWESLSKDQLNSLDQHFCEGTYEDFASAIHKELALKLGHHVEETSAPLEALPPATTSETSVLAERLISAQLEQGVSLGEAQLAALSIEEQELMKLV